MSLNAELSELFRILAALMDIKGENVFKAMAFSKVSRILKDATIDVKKAVEEGTLEEIEGIGASSRRVIEQYVRTGKSEDFDAVAATVPAGLIPMLEIPNLGPKTIALLWKQRGITSIDELAKAIDAGKLAELPGMGEKKIQLIKQGLALRTAAGKRIGIVTALPLGEMLAEQLRHLSGVAAAEVAGSLRRRSETVGDLDLVCAVKKGAGGEAVAEAFVEFPQVHRVQAKGAAKVSIATADDLQVDLRIVPEEHFGATLMYLTGSKAHNVHLRGLAQAKKMTLNEWGLYELDQYEKAKKSPGAAPAAKPVAAKTEREIYNALGLKWIEPELREDRGEIEAAAADALPKLIELKDIRGDLHCHTNASDGRSSIEQMAQAALDRGYEYLAITDHSKTQVIANGLTAQRLAKHAAEIRRISSSLKGITLLAGCEVDILADGRLDFEDAVLAELDFVVASPHVALKQPPAKATDRLLRAVENRYVNVIGHPTGRLIFEREGLTFDFEKVFKAAAATGTALEINGAYPRLDLNDVQARAALAAGVKLSVDTDAHSTEGLDDMRIGVFVARRAWASSRDVINGMTLGQLRQFIAHKRK
ncbi:MAG: DNA polymerase/3'-5' exonuclease PolX [Tepidisphaeraceae bacterium]|jgi:DNA polymerase (family 10)